VSDRVKQKSFHSSALHNVRHQIAFLNCSPQHLGRERRSGALDLTNARAGTPAKTMSRGSSPKMSVRVTCAVPSYGLNWRKKVEEATLTTAFETLIERLA